MPAKKEAPRQQCNHCAAYFNPRTIKGAVHLASCKKYNGYTNYETWAVALWIDNDQGVYEYWREQAKEIRAEAGTLDKAVGSLSRRLCDEIKDGDGVPDLGATMFADLLGAALSEVDWYEIAENMLNGAS